MRRRRSTDWVGHTPLDARGGACATADAGRHGPVSHVLVTHAGPAPRPARAGGVDPDSPLGLFMRRCRATFNQMAYQVRWRGGGRVCESGFPPVRGTGKLQGRLSVGGTKLQLHGTYAGGGSQEVADLQSRLNAAVQEVLFADCSAARSCSSEGKGGAGTALHDWACADAFLTARLEQTMREVRRWGRARRD